MEQGIQPSEIIEDNSNIKKKLLLIIFGLMGLLLLIYSSYESLVSPSSHISIKIYESLGIAFIVTAITATYNEFFVRKDNEFRFSHELAKELAKIQNNDPKFIRDLTKSIANCHDLAKNIAHTYHTEYKVKVGLKQICNNRFDCIEYSEWAMNQKPQKIHCLGRSVLHQMNKDFHNREKILAEEMRNKLGHGSQITIVFTDPTSDVIKQISDQENRDILEIYKPLANSVKLCTELFCKLQQIIIKRTNPPKLFSLDIRIISSHIIQISYHKVENLNQNDQKNKTIIGFYLESKTTFDQPAFDVQDPQIRNYFDKYYEKVHSDSVPFLQWEPQQQDHPQFFEAKYVEIYNFYKEKYPQIIDEVKMVSPDDLRTMIREWKQTQTIFGDCLITTTNKYSGGRMDETHRTAAIHDR